MRLQEEMEVTAAVPIEELHKVQLAEAAVKAAEEDAASESAVVEHVAEVGAELQEGSGAGSSVTVRQNEEPAASKQSLVKTFDATSQRALLQTELVKTEATEETNEAKEVQEDAQEDERASRHQNQQPTTLAIHVHVGGSLLPAQGTSPQRGALLPASPRCELAVPLGPEPELSEASAYLRGAMMERTARSYAYRALVCSGIAMSAKVQRERLVELEVSRVVSMRPELFKRQGKHGEEKRDLLEELRTVVDARLQPLHDDFNCNLMEEAGGMKWPPETEEEVGEWARVLRTVHVRLHGDGKAAWMDGVQAMTNSIEDLETAYMTLEKALVAEKDRFVQKSKTEEPEEEDDISYSGLILQVFDARKVMMRCWH